MTKHNTQLDWILDGLASEASTDDMTHDWDADVSHAKQAILALIDEASVLGRLEELAKVKADGGCKRILPLTYFIQRYGALTELLTKPENQDERE